MKIVYVNSARGWEGGHTSAAELGLGLAEKGHEIIVLCHPESAIRRQLEGDGRLTVRPIAIRVELNPYRVLQLANLNRRARPDLVLADNQKDLKLSVAARRLIGDFPIVHRHGAPSVLQDGPIHRRVWGRAIQTMIVNSHTMRERMLAETPWLEQVRIEVIHNGKDTRRFRPLPNLRAPMRAELGIPENAFVVSFHGTVQPRKKVETLVRAVASLPASLRVHALIIGGGPTLPDVRRLATELRAPVIFSGIRPDIPEVLSAADAAAHLSQAEGFSNSVTESMACGLPLILSDATSHPEQVDDGIQGLLVPPGEPSAVADAIRWLATDPEGRARMGAAARQRAVKEFSRELMVERYEKVLGETVAAYRSADRDD